MRVGIDLVDLRLASNETEVHPAIVHTSEVECGSDGSGVGIVGDERIFFIVEFGRRDAELAIFDEPIVVMDAGISEQLVSDAEDRELAIKAGPNRIGRELDDEQRRPWRSLLQRKIDGAIQFRLIVQQAGDRRRMIALDAHEDRPSGRTFKTVHPIGVKIVDPGAVQSAQEPEPASKPCRLIEDTDAGILEAQIQHGGLMQLPVRQAVKVGEDVRSLPEGLAFEHPIIADDFDVEFTLPEERAVCVAVLPRGNDPDQDNPRIYNPTCVYNVRLTNV